MQYDNMKLNEVKRKENLFVEYIYIMLNVRTVTVVL